MNIDIRYKTAFATLFVTLAPGESIVAEAGAMASMSRHIQIKTRFNGLWSPRGSRTPRLVAGLAGSQETIPNITANYARSSCLH